MRIPDIQDRLRELSDELSVPELGCLADALSRRRASAIAPNTSARMTDEIRAKIWDMKNNCPAISHAEIARRLHINQGRVSETLRGKRS